MAAGGWRWGVLEDVLPRCRRKMPFKIPIRRSLHNNDLLPRLRKPVLITHGRDDVKLLRERCQFGAFGGC